MAALGGLWRRRLYTDLTLIVEGKPIKCHKIILASASPYFHSRLFNGRRESPIDKIFIANVMGHVVNDILDFVYTGQCHLTLDNVEEMLKAANLFQIAALQDMADLYLSENIDATNCLRLFKLANTINATLTREQAIWVIKNNFFHIWQSPIFRQLSCKELILLIGASDLNVPDENSVCNAILAWLEGDANKRRFMLSEILRHVRLPQKLKEYIKQTLEQDDIVKKDIVCQTLMRKVKRSNRLSMENRLSENLAIQNEAMQDDVILILGGIINEDAKFKCKQQVLAFNLEFRKYYSMAPLPMGCDSGVACCRFGSDVFVSGLGETRQNLARYISSQNMWRVLTPMTIGRRGHAMVLHENAIYVLGGMVDQTVDGVKRITTMIEKYDIKKNRWNLAANLPEAVWGLSAVVHNAKIITFGGYHTRETPTTSVQMYDLKSGLTRITSQLPFPIALTQTIECDGTFYIICPTGNILKTTDCWRFQYSSSLPDFKRALFGTALHRKRLYILGGKFNSDVYSDMRVIDLSNNSVQTLSDTLPQPMYGFGTAAITLKRSQMVHAAFEM